MRAAERSCEAKPDRPEPAKHPMPAPEEMSLQGVPAMGDVLREIGLCVAVALGFALLATLYAHFM